MQTPAGRYRRFRFGLFEADPESCKLYKRGRLVHLQEQPFQILLILLERAGELVTREELKQALWPNGIVVEFDESLNTAVKSCALLLATRLRTRLLSKRCRGGDTGSWHL